MRQILVRLLRVLNSYSRRSDVAAGSEHGRSAGDIVRIVACHSLITREGLVSSNRSVDNRWVVG